MTATSGTTGNKNVRFIYRDSGVFQLQTLDDTYGSEVTVHEVQRSTTGITYQAFYAGTAGSVAERMRIDSSGNVMIGVTSTNFSERLKITFPNTQGIHLNESTSSSSVNYAYFTKSASITNVGAIFYNGSVIAYQTTSDYRLKENIAPITGALNKIAQLKPSAYRWIESQQEDTGFIAHELQEVFPQAVSGTKDATREQEYEVTPAVKDEQGKITTPAVMGTKTVPDYQGIDVSFLVATLTAAIQELKAINDTQAATITALTARIVALETV
jgi:hypothetical protein